MDAASARKEDTRRGQLEAWLGAFLAFTLLAVLFSLQANVQATLEGRPEAWSVIVRRQLVLWWVRALYIPATFAWTRWVHRHFALGGAILWHAVASLIFGVAAALTTGVIDYAIRWSPPSLTLRQVLLTNLNLTIATGVLAYALVVATYAVLRSAREMQARALEASELKRQLAESQLQLLRVQLHPHFLFNALNTVSALMGDDVRRARVALSRLGDLLRKSLDEGAEHETPLRCELDLLAPYIDLQRLRYADRLCVSIDISSDAMDARVPSFLLQPIFENAIKFGLEQGGGSGSIVLRAFRRQDCLHIEVEDDGSGLVRMSDRSRPRLGIGLGNTQARLEQLYDDACSFDLLPNARGGATVVIEIPWQTETRATSR